MADGGPPIAHCVSRIASVLSLLTELSGGGGSESKLDEATDSLVHVISRLTRFSRETNAQLHQLREREEEASRLLTKFKKVARHQKDVIDTLEALESERREAAVSRPELALPQAAPVPTVVSQTNSSSNTDLTHTEVGKMEYDAGQLQRQSALLCERDAQLAAMAKQLHKRDEECGRLRIMLRRAEGVIEAQRGLVDELEEAARKNRAGRSRVSTPSRGLPPSHTSSPRDVATPATAAAAYDDDHELRSRPQRASPSNGIPFPEFPDAHYSEPPRPPHGHGDDVVHGYKLQQLEEEKVEEEYGEEDRGDEEDGQVGEEEWEDDDDDEEEDDDDDDDEKEEEEGKNEKGPEQESDKDDETPPSSSQLLLSVSADLTRDDVQFSEGGAGGEEILASALVQAGVSVDDSFSLIQQYYSGQ